MRYFEKKILTELKEKGLYYRSVDELCQQKSLEPIVVETILKWLPDLYSENNAIADSLVRLLKMAREPFDPALLINIFENSDLNFYLKSAVALTLSYARTPDISSWIKDQLSSKDYAVEKHGLIDGLRSKGGFRSDREFMDFLKEIFNKYHNNTVLKIFQKYGDKDDFKFLEEKAKTADLKLAKEIRKAIEKKRID